MAVPIGVLTTDERGRWAENLQYLLSLSPTNHQSFNAINSSVFAVSLDHYTYALSDSSSGSPLPLPPPDSPLELTAHLHNVRSGRGDRPVHNRWYDKPIDLVVECNTRAGVLGEHSPCDALVPSIIAEYAVVQSLDEGAYGRLDEEADAEVAGWDRLEWVVDERIKRECADAEGRAKLVVDDSDDDLLWYRTYGVEWIKNSARLSPDAYIQMALQLAWYRMRGCFTATYETALTRLFHHGRTETIRTFTTDSRAFVLAMVEGKTSTPPLHALLRRAIQTHSNLTRDAATGRGIDRHLLGLQEMFLRDAGERHALFEDELFARSQIWKLSTSGLSAGHQFRGTGFGAQYNDGYGINYTAGPDNIKFGIESKHSSSLTSTREFKSAVVRALDDMRSVCLENVGVRL
ncbi:Choline O-acetyltransferase [Grifola frondosa]|uniref:Choline O-acetyltransferase n=1 Tax=Grifola frondosa TaxID=5627 RepID=A0A1C7M6X3_GRIFR|nr:Choline O-acetyltransferase [Grifola frondosa]